MRAGRGLARGHFEITGNLTRHELEILQLEIRRLGERHGVTVKVLGVERVEQSPTSRTSSRSPGRSRIVRFRTK